MHNVSVLVSVLEKERHIYIYIYIYDLWEELAHVVLEGKMSNDLRLASCKARKDKCHSVWGQRLRPWRIYCQSKTVGLSTRNGWEEEEEEEAYIHCGVCMLVYVLGPKAWKVGVKLSKGRRRQMPSSRRERERDHLPFFHCFVLFWFGWCPPTLGRADLLLQLTYSNANIFRKYPQRSTQK